MKRILSLVFLTAMITFATLTVVRSASAEEMKMVGAITKIELAADGKSATTILKDSTSGESVTIIVNDELTLDKLKDKRIVEGDEIRCKYDKTGDKNTARIFKKTAGC